MNDLSKEEDSLDYAHQTEDETDDQVDNEEQQLGGGDDDDDELERKQKVDESEKQTKVRRRVKQGGAGLSLQMGDILRIIFVIFY